MFGIRGMFLFGGLLASMAGYGVVRRRRRRSRRYALGIDGDGFGVKEVNDRGYGFPWDSGPQETVGVDAAAPQIAEPENP